MLKVFDRYEDIDFRQLMNVYAQLNCTEGKVKYPNFLLYNANEVATLNDENEWPEGKE